MAHRQVVEERKIEYALRAGRRWENSLQKRAQTVRLLNRGGPEMADTPERVRQFRERERNKELAYARAGVTESFFTERKIGPTLDLDDAPPSEAGRAAGVAVGRIVELDADGAPLEGIATGFLIGSDLILTNHHVFSTADECRNCGIQFGYEQVNGLLRSGDTYALEPSRFFYADETLDFAIVAVSPNAFRTAAPIGGLGTLRLIPSPGKILVGQPISIIQYPDGGPKKYGVRDNELLLSPSDTDPFLQYTTDTLPGSSGSPDFNKDWEIVGLHHSGVPQMQNGQILTITGKPWTKGMPDSAINWVANEGVRVSRICEHLADLKLEPLFQAVLDQLLATFKDDFGQFPAIENQNINTNMNQTLPNSSGGLVINISGPASFYLGGGTSSAPKTDSVIRVPQAEPAVVEKKLQFDPLYTKRKGYNENFLGIRVPVPGVVAARRNELLMKGNQPYVLNYHHYSVVMNQDRRLQMWSAVNVDYTPSKRRMKRADFGTDTWVPDPRIPGQLQIQDPELYGPAKKFDCGHIVRRDDTAWGDTQQEEIYANSDSFHFTNCTPQHEQFNRDVFGYHGLWGGLENQIQQQAPNVGSKLCVFGGPILAHNDIEHDFGGGTMQIPFKFWKVAIVADLVGGKRVLRAFGFILDQEPDIQKYGIEKFDPGKFVAYQVALAEITNKSGVTFDAVIVKADELAGAVDPVEIRAPEHVLVRDLSEQGGVVIAGLHPNGDRGARRRGSKVTTDI